MSGNISAEHVTPVPNKLMDEHLTVAKPGYLAVYLYGLRWRQTPPSLKKTACDLQIRELDVVAAWTYWESAGLVKITDGSMDGFSYCFSEVLREEVPPSAPDYAAGAATEAQAEQVTDTPAKTLPEQVRPEIRPAYSAAEIEHVMDNSEDVRYLFKMAEKILGRPLTYNDMNLLLSFYDWMMLPVQVIEVLLDYCVSNNHKNGRYLEKVALNWADSGIRTVEDAEEYIKAFNVDYREIMKAFGQARRDPSPKEAAYMKKWLRDYKLPVELIAEACGRTVLQTGNARFSYADKIMENWYNSEIKTLEEAFASDEEHRKGQSANGGKTSEKATQKGKKSRFANYKGREWDYDKLEKLAQEYVENSLSN